MKYKLVEKANPQNRKEKKWYANPINQGIVSKYQLSKKIAGNSSLSRREVNNVLDNLIVELPKHLMAGNSVKLGDFGTLRLSISGDGSNSPNNYSPTNIKKVKIIFTPGSVMKDELDNMQFEQGL